MEGMQWVWDLLVQPFGKPYVQLLFGKLNSKNLGICGVS